MEARSGSCPRICIKKFIPEGIRLFDAHKDTTRVERELYSNKEDELSLHRNLPKKKWSDDMFGSVGMSEILVILVVVLLLFGSKQLPDVARKIGKGYREFQKATQNARDEVKKILEDDQDNRNG